MSETRSSARRRRIYLVRHGDVSYFDARGRPVHPDTVELNEEGRGQARALGELLGSIALDRVIASGLPRTLQTAEAVVADRGLTVEVREELQEIRPGKLRNLSPGEIEAVFTGAFRQLHREGRFLGGETWGEFLDRVLPCFQDLRAETDWKHLLLVAHGGVNRAILTDVLGSGLDGFGALEQDPGALNIIDTDDTGPGDGGPGGGGGIVRLLNYTPCSPAKRGLMLTTMERIFLQYRGAAE